METMNKTLKELAQRVGITAVRGAHKDWDKMDEWQQKAKDYRITLRYKGHSYSLDFWQGQGVKDEPTAEGVLECLLNDACAVDLTFENWCNEFGYNEDSRKAYATFQACEKEGLRLKKLLGADYEMFLNAEKD